MWDRIRRHTPLIAALVVALPPMAWTIAATYRATFAVLGRDPGIFQYVAWALARGERDYSQVRDMNGPLIHFIHLGLLKLGGANEQVFRSLDFAILGAVALFTGALLPGLSERAGDEPMRIGWPVRVAWALACWVVLSAGYLLFTWWDQGQRESFYNDLLLPSLALQMFAQRPSTKAGTRQWLFVAAGALSALPCFGKPTCAVYTLGQVLAIALDDELPGSAWRSIFAFLSGCALSAFAMALLLMVYGDPAAYVRLSLEVPRLHLHIWNKSIAGCYWAWNNAPKLNYALITVGLGVFFFARRLLPRRLLPLFFWVIGGLLTFVLQAKGYPYHLHPVMAGMHLLWALAAMVFVERVAQRRLSRPVWVGVVATGVVLLSYQSWTETRLSPSMNNDWYEDRVAGGPDSPRFLEHFNGGDFYALDLRQAAAYLRRTTDPSDRVQTYGMDPYILFLAQRLSATPFIYSSELNVDAALEGATSAGDRRWLMAAARRHEDELGQGVMPVPPAAFALIDRAPFSYAADADEDFAEHCPRVAAWMIERYREAGRFGVVRIWLRNDLYERNAARALN
jgi:hypothetical protein